MIYRSRRMHALALLAGLAATLVTIGVRPSASAEVTPTVSPVRTFYVSPSGSDSNPGSQAQPWKSFYKASQTVTGGDLVLFENGRYVETRAPWLRDRARNGTASKPIVLKARNSHGAVLRFSGLPTEKIYIDIDYVTVQGFVMTQDKPGTTTMDKFVNCFNNTNCSVVDNVISGGFEEGVKGYHAKNMAVAKNVISGMVHEGIDVMDSSGMVVRDNHVYDVGRVGVLVKGGARNAQIYNNWVQARTRPMDVAMGVGGVSCAGCAYSTSGYEAYNTVAWNNIVSSELKGNIRIGLMLQGTIDSAFLNNVVLGAKIALDTHRGGDPNGVGGTPWTAASVRPTFKNNILADCTFSATQFVGGESTRLVDYNLVSNCPAPPVQAHEAIGDPKFVNRASDWHLQPGSVAIGRGVAITAWPSYSDSRTPASPASNLTADRDGQPRSTPWDIGAYGH